jgi:iron complex outermembrane receptor protein
MHASGRVALRRARSRTLAAALSVLSLLAGARIVRGQEITGAIAGRVTDEAGQPVAGALVMVQAQGGPRRGAQVEGDGRYRVAGLPAGAYLVRVQAIGFRSAERPDVRLAAGEERVLDVRLSPSTTTLSGVEVVGRRRYEAAGAANAMKLDVPLLLVPQSVHVVTADFLEDQNATRLDDVFRNVSGVNAFSSYQDYNVRGFRTSQVLYNGLRGNPYDFFAAPKMNNVERVEILKGPASVLFGSLDPGGVINIVTKVPEARAGAELGLTYASFERVQLAGDVTGPVSGSERVAYRLNAFYEDAGSFRRFQELQNVQIAPALSWRPSRSTAITLRGEYLDDERDGQRDRGTAAPGGDVGLLPLGWTANEPTDAARNRGRTAELSVQQALPRAWQATAFVRYARSQWENRYHEPRGFRQDSTTGGRLVMRRQWRDQEFTNDQYVADVRLSGEVRTGALTHRLLAGGDLLAADATTLAATANAVPALDVFSPQYGQANPAGYALTAGNSTGTSRRYGAYLQDLVTLPAGFSVLGGLRYDGFRDETRPEGGDADALTDQALTLRGGLVWQPRHWYSLYASYSEGFQPQAVSSQSTALGGPFRPETSRQVEGGAKAEWFGGRLGTTVAAYQLVKENILLQVDNPGDTINPFRYRPRGQVESRGVEFDALGSVTSNWSVVANYTYNDAAVTEDVDTTLVGRQVENAPRHAAALWTRVDMPRTGVGLGTGVTYVGARNTFDTTVLPGYTVADAALFYDWRALGLTLRVQNLFDRRHFVGGYNDRTLFPGAPRTVQATVRTRF